MGTGTPAGRARPASALASNRVPRHKEALRAAAAPVSAIEEALREVKHEQKYYDFVDPSDLPTPKWIPALTETNFASRSRRGGSMQIPRKDITDVEMTLAVSSGGALGLKPARSKSPTRVRSHSVSIDRAPSVQGGRDAMGVRGLWAPAAQKLLQDVFEAKCVDLKLKPLKERRERFFHKVRSQSTHETVCLCDSGLGPLGGAAVAAMLKMHRCSDLDLCGNQIRDQGASAIAEMLEHNRSLTRLDLRSNDIGVDGASAIFFALAKNSTLTDLDLGVPPVGGGVRNRLGAKAVETLSSLLKSNRSLFHLSLHGTGMGVEGSRVFSQGFSFNTSLRRLDLGLNQLEDDGMVILCDAIEQGGCLEQVNLSNNKIANHGASRLAGEWSSDHRLLANDLYSDQIPLLPVVYARSVLMISHAHHLYPCGRRNRKMPNPAAIARLIAQQNRRKGSDKSGARPLVQQPLVYTCARPERNWSGGRRGSCPGALFENAHVAFTRQE